MEKKLSEEKLKKYKQILLAEKEKTEALIREINDVQKKHTENGNDSVYSLHQADVGSDTNLAEKRAFYINKEIAKLKRLNYALKKVYEKDYGICEMCGEEIPEERLKVIPYARYCIVCKNADEKRNKRR